MATSPFQTSGNVGDIAPVSLKGGFTPSTGVADVLLNVANAVIPVITKNLEDDITEDVTGKIQAVSEALKATRFPSIQKSMFSAEALANPNVKLALKEFTLIQDAAANGRLPSNFALERLEIIQNDAIRRSPEFEAEIRGAMSDATGVDPTKTLFSRLISTSSKKQSAQEKAFEQLDIQAIKLGTTREAVIGMNQVAAQNQIEQQSFDLSAKRGTYTLNTAGAEVVNRGSALVTDIMSTMLEMNTAGVPIGVEEENALIAQVTASFGAASAALQAKTAQLNVSGTAIAAALKPLEETRDQTIAMIKDGTLSKLLKQNSDVIIADAQNTFLNNAEYGRLYAVLGKEGTLKFMEFKTTFKGNKKAEALLQVLNTEAGGLFKVDEIMKQGSRIGDGANVSGGAKQARILAAASGVANHQAGDEYQIKSLEDIKKYGGVELAWSNFGNNDVLTATAKSSQLRAAFINLQATTTAGLSEDLLRLASDPNVQLERMVLTETGLVVEPRPVAERIGLSTIDAGSDASMLTYTRRFNRANNISAKYNGAGLLPSARYQGSQMYWDTVRKAANEVATPKDKANEVRKVVIGADGKLVFDGGA